MYKTNISDIGFMFNVFSEITENKKKKAPDRHLSGALTIHA